MTFVRANKDKFAVFYTLFFEEGSRYSFEFNLTDWLWLWRLFLLGYYLVGLPIEGFR